MHEAEEVDEVTARRRAVTGESDRLVPTTIDSLVIDCVDRARKIVAALVVTRRGGEHRIGHLRGEGWFCSCSRGSRCKAISVVRKLVPPMAP